MNVLRRSFVDSFMNAFEERRKIPADDRVEFHAEHKETLMVDEIVREHEINVRWRDCQVVNFHFFLSFCPERENSARSMNETDAFTSPPRIFLFSENPKINFLMPDIARAKAKNLSKFSPPLSGETKKKLKRAAHRNIFSPERSQSCADSYSCQTSLIQFGSEKLRFGFRSTKQKKKENKKKLKAKSIFWWCENSNNGNGACNLLQPGNSLEKK